MRRNVGNGNPSNKIVGAQDMISEGKYKIREPRLKISLMGRL